jgi:hypothetical protein
MLRLLGLQKTGRRFRCAYCLYHQDEPYLGMSLCVVSQKLTDVSEALNASIIRGTIFYAVSLRFYSFHHQGDLSSWMFICVVSQKLTDVSEVLNAPIIWGTIFYAVSLRFYSFHHQGDLFSWTLRRVVS